MFRLLGRDSLQRTRRTELGVILATQTSIDRPAALLQTVLIGGFRSTNTDDFPIRMTTMSETTPKAQSEFEKAAAEDRGRELAERVLVVPGSQQEMVAAADCDRHVASRHVDFPLRHSRDSVHLYAVLMQVCRERRDATWPDLGLPLLPLLWRSLRITEVVVSEWFELVVQFVDQGNTSRYIECEYILIGYTVEILDQRPQAVAMCSDDASSCRFESPARLFGASMGAIGQRYPSGIPTTEAQPDSIRGSGDLYRDIGGQTQ